MLETTSRGFAPQTARGWSDEVGGPTAILRTKGNQGPRVWLTQMERYMRLMRYAPTNWLDVVAMRDRGCSELLGECGFSKIYLRVIGQSFTRGPNSKM